MLFEWDETKNISNLKKHSFELFEGAIIFEDPARIEMVDDRFDYGETRNLTIGIGTDGLMSVCWTVRGEKRRLISVRRASKKERRLYDGNSKHDS
jgi:uncharacterized DUF497 family protein